MPITYLNAPIIEAVIDLRISLPNEFDVSSFDILDAELSIDLPNKSNFTITTAQFQSNEPQSATIDKQHSGYRYESSDKKKILIMSKEAYTFSHLAPYVSWDNFHSEAQKFWKLYEKISNPVSINRLGLRYINRIDFPMLERLNMYLKLYPTVPDIPNRPALGFYMQLQVPQPDIDGMLIINEARVDAENPDIFSVLIDIDVFREKVIEASDDWLAWDIFEQLRNRKNLVFEEIITQKTRELLS